MRVLVPYATCDPKSRLSPVLSAPERRAFALAMLCDVVDAVRAVGYEPELLVPEPLDVARDVEGDSPLGDAKTPGDANGSIDTLASLTQIVDDRPLTAAVNAALDGPASEQAVVTADLALATPTALRRLFAVGGDVAVAPGRGGGTNALVVRDPAFSVDYHGASYRDHRRIAAEAGLSVGVVDSMRLATDVDRPADLAEVLLHGDGRARAWLVEAGFEIDDASEGRVGVERS
ncbi:2-phospho-L-lactate guanylyltransferase [Halobellus captivus]|uniref:2-phospho-L-lactate guanylyltransferase n=1 Tax=Halobellus captivus TaxID=2592614 RepID=UPI0011A12A41|nr:2-phospho-L-lactate guanylyltransferase [Halobellus captivus]